MLDLTERARYAMQHYASQGVKELHMRHPDITPVISHICFKFTDQEHYQNTTEKAASLGVITRELFNDKEITWLYLDQPIETSGFAVNWVEMVEPKEKQHTSNDVSAIVFYAHNLADVVKLPASDPNVTLRFQSRWVQPVISTK